MRFDFLRLSAFFLSIMLLVSCAKPEAQLQQAITKNDVVAVKRIIKEGKVNLNDFGMKGKGASLLCKALRKPEIFYTLADAGAELNPNSSWDSEAIISVMQAFKL